MEVVTKLGDIELLKGSNVTIFVDSWDSNKEFFAKQLAIIAKEQFNKKAAMLWMHNDIADVTSFGFGSREDLCINQALLNSDEDYESFIKEGGVDLVILTESTNHLKDIKTDALVLSLSKESVLNLGFSGNLPEECITATKYRKDVLNVHYRNELKHLEYFFRCDYTNQTMEECARPVRE